MSSALCQEIGYAKNGLFCVEWDVTPSLNQFADSDVAMFHQVVWDLGAAGRLRQNCFLRREDVRGKVKWLQGLQGGPMCRCDCETFRIPPLVSKRTIRIRDEGVWSGVGAT